ncbi:MAG: hypothetical protein KDJ73_10215 [Notoacmeibacter sp.]|nr:hypothetical protein [Notoacmeibacter sp.]MCB2004726.1 hypothetical protein [Rhodoferax sp.]
MDTKPWYLSKTIWASLVTILSALGGLFGLPVSSLDSGATAEMLLQAVTAISGLIAIFGRLSADTKIA